MGIFGGCPSSRRRVAGVALTAIDNVTDRLVLRVVTQIRRGIAVTGRAIPCRDGGIGPGMVHRARHEGDETVVVASIALRASRDVSYRFSLCVDRGKTTAVASRTLGRRPCVIHCRRFERIEIAMTGVALCRGRNVRTRFGKG